ncbi:MAG: flagellar hook-associated protein FlgL [Candidatus Cohnella colombiensis]|uniref:Flagellar hook-associated protein FlgL n=1 Tax=Candidatus Cohnella colombiensis TaxID=3121368 RepID=A0AA95JCH0_9BACL|nr:MAG: flagellar hook-associated protein FlgL [Cohnella sp.]
MYGRVTQGTITNQLLRNINVNLKQSQSLQEKLSTGRNINRPSDDPVGITYALRYRSDLAVNDRYLSNVDSAASQLDFNDTMLTQVNDVLKRVKELAVNGANGTNPLVAMNNIALEMEQLKEQLIDIANTQFKGKYIFNGQFTDTKPYDPNDPNKGVTDPGKLEYIISTGVKMSVNLSGNEVFGYPAASTGVTSTINEEDNIFNVLDNMINALRAGVHSDVNSQIALLETRMDKVLTQQAEVGSRVNRLELMQERLKDLSVNLETLQSLTEDIDIEDVIIRSKVNESIYQASLSVGSKIIQPTLIDFLR